MSRLTEITDLFAKLASQLQSGLPLQSDEEACDPSISSLNQSLNLDEGSRVRVLDTALSLMCFKAPQVFNSTVEYLVKTIVTVLSSSISCKVLRCQRKEFLQVGSSISGYECQELIRVCVDVLGKLEGHVMLSHMLLPVVLRVAISASCYESLFPLKSFYIVKLRDERNTPVRKLHCLMPEEISVNEREIPLRLFLWYLDPLSLKHDISRILRETVRRPFLCLKKELHERMNWHSIIICLVLSPTMFIETRDLLHKWFLLTGLASVLELQVELVSSILDILARPMWWGMSMEVGSKLPFSHAYFPSNSYLLATLTGPISCKSFLDLVQLIREMLSSNKEHSDPTHRHTATKVEMTDHRSIWAMLMNFPSWFYFATMLLFAGKNYQDNFLLKYASEAAENEQIHDVHLHFASAAQYLAWVMSPISEAHSDLLVECLIEISRSWTPIQLGSDAHNNDRVGCKRRLKKPKFHENNEGHTAPKKCDSWTMGLWLKEFHNSYVKFCNNTVKSCAFTEEKAENIFSLQKNLLFRRIPLGILIGCVNYLNEEGCELLLHYAATGEILWSREIRNTGLKHIKQKCNGHGNDEDSIRCSENSDKWKEAVAGTSLVFNLFNVIEDISASAFETEESGLDFICWLKVKAVRYLVKCIKELLQLRIDENEGGVLMLMDLRRRLVWWKHQGQGIFQGYSGLDDVISALNCKISSF